MRTVILLISILFLTKACSTKEKTEAPLFEEEGMITTGDNKQLYYKRIGNGLQNLIVPAALYLQEDLRPLANSNRSIVFYDMRNRGRSAYVKDSTSLTIQHDVSDLEDVRNYFGFDKISLLGYSYLGLMVALYANDHPEHIDRIIQLGPVPLRFGTEYQLQYTARDTASVIDSVEYKRLDTLINNGFFKSNPKEFCELDWNVMKFLLVGNRNNAEKLRSVCELSNEWPVNLWRHFGFHFVSVQKLNKTFDDIKIDKPVLTFHGTKDRNAPYGSGREWVYNLPNARLLTVTGAAHNLWLESDVIKPINEFLSGSWPGRAETVDMSPLKK